MFLLAQSLRGVALHHHTLVLRCRTYHALQVAYLVFCLVQELVLVALLLKQKQRFSEIHD